MPLTLQRLNKVYGTGVHAVRDLDLEIRDGEFFTLLGPSGCGKTTTLRMIAGLERPTSGRIFIGGRDFTDVPPRDRDLAMVFQNYALYPHMTVYNNLALNLQVRRVPRRAIEARVGEDDPCRRSDGTHRRRGALQHRLQPGWHAAGRDRDQAGHPLRR